MEEVKKKKRPAHKVVAIEFDNSGESTSKGLFQTLLHPQKRLSEVAEELQAAMLKMKRQGYNFRIHEYAKGFLLVGDFEEEPVVPGPPSSFPFMFMPFRRPEPSPMLSVNPEHVKLINRMLELIDRMPPAELPKALPSLVADHTKGISGEQLRAMIADFETIAEHCEKEPHEQNCVVAPRVRQIVDVVKKQVQLQTS